MDSGNSGSMSSSGGEDQDHETSRPESLPGYLNSPTQFGSSDPILHPSLLSHYQNHNHQPTTTTTLFDHHNYNYDHHNLHTTLSHQIPQSNTSNPNFMPDPRSTRPNSTNPIPNPPPSSHHQGPSRASSSSAAGQTRNSKKRTRASRRAPTTVLTTDTSNFRAMVQEFTGIPAPPFAASSSSSSSFSRRFDMFGSGMRSAHHLETLGPLYPLRPSAQKVQQPTPFLSSNNSPSNSALLMMSNSGGLVDATNIATTSNNSNNNFNPTTYQLLNQGLFPSMQNPILTFQHEQQPHPFHSSSMNLASFGARPARGVIGNLAMHSSLEDPLGGMSHGSYTGQLGGGVGGSSLDSSHVAASDGHDGWRDHGVGSNDGRLSAALDQHLRPNLDKCLEMNNVNSNTRGEGTVESWICPNSE
ncbi:PREDICTED: striatin homolog [Prunus mume]|uniref:Striatin homolog n=1 Tax=Prunus mume TaxID=102107 RepID=A0ABM0N549_PRUMU|nr:PREDICTED: striatin homolog [Prunus mume]